MEHLWAPWRKAYVQTTAGSPTHIFAEICQSNDDVSNHVLLRGKSCFALLNAFPYNTAHCLVVPYKMTPDLDDLSEGEVGEMMSMLKRLKGAITRVFNPHGFNIGLNLGSAAGAGIAEHIHWHLVPRWRSDSNFMTTVGGVRVHPSELDSVYQLLRKPLAEV